MAAPVEVQIATDALLMNFNRSRDSRDNRRLSCVSYLSCLAPWHGMSLGTRWLLTYRRLAAQ